ncbi:zinc-dependent peptidase [Aeromonas cavernicola]|uniref:M90 family metallopeptidase n=1 Tax=Aeromonas cavernicola TaxID=1006623 RepID=UPI001F45A5C9|nr:M90 family metallopeptidase [Aeromonas cavernicola]
MRNRRAAKAQQQHACHTLWQQALAAVPILQGLTTQEQTHLIALGQQLLHRKTLTQLGVALTPQQQAVLALQAALPILHLGVAWYRGFHEIILIPTPVTRRQEEQDEFGLVSDVLEENAGEAWPQGPLVLAWRELQQDGDWDGVNLLIHELAHKLDMLGGEADGAPPLPRGMNPTPWQQAFQAAFDALCQQLDRGDVPAIDPYAAEHPAEFFAICCELFFTDPLRLRAVYPAVYQQLSQFFSQDPAQRFPPTRLLAGEGSGSFA